MRTTLEDFYYSSITHRTEDDARLRDGEGGSLVPTAKINSRRELITGPSGRNSLPFPYSSHLWALSCVLERGNVFAKKSTR